ncbi:MAG: efflux RND transporter periplasmic adaptor subunit, partial [Kiritimatiellia bacterium]
MKKIISALVLAVLLAGIGFRIYQKSTTERSSSASRGRRGGTVRTQPVRRETIRDVRLFTGTLLPAAQFVVAPKIAGRLEKLLVNIGEEVEKGRGIALLDSAEFAQQVEEARAELEVARANVVSCRSDLELATREVARVRELRKAQVASEAELDRV